MERTMAFLFHKSAPIFALSLGVAFSAKLKTSEIKPLEPDRDNAREGIRRRALSFVMP